MGNNRVKAFEDLHRSNSLGYKCMCLPMSTPSPMTVLARFEVGQARFHLDQAGIQTGRTPDSMDMDCTRRCCYEHRDGHRKKPGRLACTLC